MSEQTFVEDRADHQRTPYLFNGKELDKETGLYYYGARYYDPRISMFLGVDPKAEKYASWSQYAYTFDNPIIFVDPDGMWPVYTHYRMTKKALMNVGVSKATAREIAHYSATYADHPSKLVLAANQVLGVFAGVNPKNLSYKDGVNYSKTEEAQSYNRKDMLSIHATKGKDEDISNKQAVDRTKDEATATFEKYKGKDLNTLSTEEKQEVGMAFHQTEDVDAHQGCTWAEKRKDNEHSIWRDLFGGRKESRAAANAAAQTYYKKDEEK